MIKENNKDIKRQLENLEIRRIQTMRLGSLNILVAIAMSSFLIYTVFISGDIPNPFDINNNSKAFVQLAKTLENNEMLGSTKKDAIEIIANAIKETNNSKSISIQDESTRAWLNIISLFTVRIGAIIVGLYLVQVFVSFARYYFRIANRLQDIFFIIDFANNDAELVRSISPIFSNNSIDFGKEHKISHHDVIDIIDKLNK